MMKKLLLWSALLMMGFAFYSCDDVVDNPAQDPASVWNYSVSVKFADFDFKGYGDTSGPYTYEAPTTLYVLNEDLVPMGTITTEAAPAAGTAATYAGTLTGTIGDNLIIITKLATDYTKQDGTLKSAKDNGIIQTAKVPIKIYNANSQTLTTGAAKMENAVAIVRFDMGFLQPGDAITVESDNIATEDNTMAITLSEETTFNTSDIFLAVPTDAIEENDYTILSNKQNGEVAKATLDDLTFKKGEINFADGISIPFGVPFNVSSVDLTKWYAYENKKNPNATGEQTYSLFVADGDEITFTQSESKSLDSLRVDFFTGTSTNKATVNLDNIKLGKDRSFQLANGDYTINLIGDNEFGALDLGAAAKCKIQGNGTLKYNQLFMTDWGWPAGNEPEFTIDKNTDLQHIYLENAKLTIAEGVIVNVSMNEEIDPVEITRDATLTLAKGAELNVESKAKDRAVIRLDGQWNYSTNSYEGHPTITMKEGAKIAVQGAKENVGMRIANATLAMGKGAKVYLQGGLDNEYGIGQGAYFKDATVTLADSTETEFTAIGMDRVGLQVDGNTTITINGKAKFIAKNKLDGNGVVVYSGNTLNINGTGTFAASASKKAAVVGGTLNIGTGSVVEFTQLEGATESAVIVEDYNGAVMNIAADVKSVTVTSGQATEPICIATDAAWPEEEIALAKLVATPANFNDTKAAGVRTITPKPAE